MMWDVFSLSLHQKPKRPRSADNIEPGIFWPFTQQQPLLKSLLLMLLLAAFRTCFYLWFNDTSARETESGSTDFLLLVSLMFRVPPPPPTGASSLSLKLCNDVLEPLLLRAKFERLLLNSQGLDDLELEADFDEGLLFLLFRLPLLLLVGACCWWWNCPRYRYLPLLELESLDAGCCWVTTSGEAEEFAASARSSKSRSASTSLKWA